VRKRTGVASTIFNAQRQVGGAIGVALLTAVISAPHPGADNRGLRRGQLAPFHLGLLVCAGVAVAAALAALSVRDGDAAWTMIRHRDQSPAAAAAGDTLDAAGARANSPDS
jgi:hypothetical protein